MAIPAREQELTEGKALERLIFFSDAIFAIAMTLLVLDIPRPPRGADLTKFLTTNDGKFLAFFISFWVIAIFWLGHHRLFRYVRHLDHGLITLNLVLLFWVAFLPYPSAILGDRADTVSATVFYAAVMCLAGLSSATLTWYTVSHRGFTGAVHPAMARYYAFRGLAATFVFAISIPIALFVSPTAAQAWWFALFAIQFGGRRIAERRAGVDAAD